MRLKELETRDDLTLIFDTVLQNPQIIHNVLQGYQRHSHLLSLAEPECTRGRAIGL